MSNKHELYLFRTHSLEIGTRRSNFNANFVEVEIFVENLAFHELEKFNRFPRIEFRRTGSVDCEDELFSCRMFVERQDERDQSKASRTRTVQRAKIDGRTSSEDDVRLIVLLTKTWQSELLIRTASAIDKNAA